MSSRPLLSRALARVLAPLACALGLGLTGCPTVDNTLPPRNPDTVKWLKRANGEYQDANLTGARDSVAKALSLSPDDEEARMLAAKVHFALLDYAEAVRLLRGIKGSEAAALRGRALWYKGDLEAAADAFEGMLNDPEVVDDWAKSIAKLARQGAGRRPFEVTGGILAATELQRVSQTAPYFVVPVSIDGSEALALVSTGTSEVMLDRSEPSWVQLGFGAADPHRGRIEVHDVPALTQDLSQISQDVGQKITAVIGVNLLRHLHVTLDFGGRQFVARSFSPPPPPDATRIPIFYTKSCGMVMKSSLGDKDAPLLIDTSLPQALALDEDGWKKAGVQIKDLKVIPEDKKQLKRGVVPMLKVGALEIPQLPAVLGSQQKQVEDKSAFNVDGTLGNLVLAFYRMTFGDGGRLLWLEDNTSWVRAAAARQQLEPPPELLPNEGVLPPGTPSVILPDPKAPPAGVEPGKKPPLAPSPGLTGAPPAPPPAAPKGGAAPKTK